MAADVLTPAILQYLDHGAYPDSEDIASANLSSSSLAALLQELRKAQDDVKEEIRGLSRAAAPDIDSWISRAKDLQADILRSRDTARQIVQDAEVGKELGANVDDTGNKVDLLEKEVLFNETLTGTLEHVKYANGLLERAQQEAVRGSVERALARLEDAEASIAGLGGVRGSRAVDVLQQRAAQLREGLIETATECWDALISVDVDGRKLRIQKQGLKATVPEAAVPDISLDDIVTAITGLGVFESLVHKLSQKIERAILRPRMKADEHDQVAQISVSGDELSCSAKSNDLKPASLFRDLRSILDFLSTKLPSTVATPLSTHLIPMLTSRLESHWLDPSIPVSMDDIASFQSLLTDVSSLADYIEGSLEWNGADQLREWVQNAPRAWLTKRREAVLGDARNFVFEGLRERKVAERVETRMVSTEDGLPASDEGGAEDDWDTAWDEPEEETIQQSTKRDAQDEDDDDASAWDMDDDDPLAGKKDDHNDNEDDDAWGWGDEDNATQKPPSPIKSRKESVPQQKSPSKPNGAPNEQEMTLRETFTVTAIPDGIFSILQRIISDAEALSGTEFESSAIAPAATGLYTLPTLALAIYRATAPTAYAKIETGNMLIYNDASRLADQLRTWQSAQPSRSRLKVDNDVAALESFAKRAYSSEMDSQRTILRDLLDGAQGFGNCTQQPFKQECEGATEASVDRLRDVHGFWKGILSNGALLQSIGGLLGTLTSKMINEIEELGDIGEEDSRQLKLLCDKVLTTSDLFIQRNENAPEGQNQDQDMTFVYCPTWLKFQYLAEILESSLADIKWMWKEGELSLEFGADEVVELIEALFADSELRRQAVREIRRGG